MIITDNKKARTLDGKGLIDVITKEVNNMSNITHIADGKQVQISEHQLKRFVDFINNAEESFNSLEVMVRLIMEKSEQHTTAYTLASIIWDKLDDWMTMCHEEVRHFKQHSPKAASLVLKECAA